MARIGNTVLSLGATAASAIAANRFVGFDDAQAGAVGQRVKGVADYAAAKGDPVALTAKGTAFVETGGVFAAGDLIISDALGRAIVSTANTDFVKGEALTASTAVGGYAEILLR
jgi:hypothetical protein